MKRTTYTTMLLALITLASIPFQSHSQSSFKIIEVEGTKGLFIPEAQARSILKDYYKLKFLQQENESLKNIVSEYERNTVLFNARLSNYDTLRVNYEMTLEAYRTQINNYSELNKKYQQLYQIEKRRTRRLKVVKWTAPIAAALLGGTCVYLLVR